MNHHEDTFVANNHTIYCQRWQPPSTAKGVLLIAHGLAEHSGRYARVAEYFVNHGYAVCALDHIGHGKSDGKRCHIKRFSDFTETLTIFLGKIKTWIPDSPVFLIGHSMGGLISAAYLLQNQNAFRGCILSGPAIKASEQPSAALMLLNRIISVLVPTLGMMKLAADGVSRDPVEVKAYIEDPLVHTGKVSSRMVAELFKTMSEVQTNAAAITLPVLLLHGGEDKLAAPESSTFLNEHVGSKDKKLIIYDGLYHEIFNEPERDQVFADVLAWLDEHNN